MRYGTTVMGYVQALRVTEAKQLLRFTDLPVREVSLACGVGEAAYFSRVFRRVEGVSSSELRVVRRSRGASSLAIGEQAL